MMDAGKQFIAIVNKPVAEKPDLRVIDNAYEAYVETFVSVYLVE